MIDQNASHWKFVCDGDNSDSIVVEYDLGVADRTFPYNRGQVIVTQVHGDSYIDSRQLATYLTVEDALAMAQALTLAANRCIAKREEDGD